MIKLKVFRFELQKDWSIGQLFENGRLTGYTVEDEVRNFKVKGETAIPTGTYKLEYRDSPKFSTKWYWNETTKKLIFFTDYNALSRAEKRNWQAHKLIWITNVPNFKYILIHWGNTDLDSDGCLIIGDKMGVIKDKSGDPKKSRSGVINSRNFYREFYERVFPEIDGDSTIEIINKPV